MTKSGTTNDNEWQGVTTSGTTNDNEWQRVTKNENEWRWMRASVKMNEYDSE